MQEDVAAADVIFANVALPKALVSPLHQLLASAKSGCRCMMLWALDFEFEWRLDAPCHFHRTRANLSPTDHEHEKYELLETTWSTNGRFCIYTHLPGVEPVITRETATEARKQRLL